MEESRLPTVEALADSPDKAETGSRGNHDQLSDENEVRQKKFAKKDAKIPSVRAKLFRQNSGQKRKSKIEFDENDFDISVPKVGKTKKVAFNPRISRSDWDIYSDSRGGGEVREEIELLLSRNSKELSIHSKEPEHEDDFKSQYFDAMETLSEDEKDNEDVNSEDEYEDMEEELEEERVNLPKRRQISVELKNQPSAVQRRVKALKKLLLEQKQLETLLYRDIHTLEGYFYKQHRDRIYTARRRLVEGDLAQATITEEAEDGDEETGVAEVGEPGIPGFWLRVLLNSKNISQIVQVKIFHLREKL